MHMHAADICWVSTRLSCGSEVLTRTFTASAGVYAGSTCVGAMCFHCPPATGRRQHAPRPSASPAGPSGSRHNPRPPAPARCPPWLPPPPGLPSPRAARTTATQTRGLLGELTGPAGSSPTRRAQPPDKPPSAPRRPPSQRVHPAPAAARTRPRRPPAESCSHLAGSAATPGQCPKPDLLNKLWHIHRSSSDGAPCCAVRSLGYWSARGGGRCWRRT
jgi:hypothetical protein